MSHPSTSGLPSHNTKQEESDDNEDLFTVPDVESNGPTSTAAEEVLKHQQQLQLSNSSEGQQSQKNRRGRNPADREYRRIKRLLRNRVSAQQARERKKFYVNDLESRAKHLHDNNLKLEEEISTLINENAMLRKVLMNTRPKIDRSMELQNDQSGSS